MWYREDMILLNYVDYCLMFGTYKDKIYGVYNDINAHFKIEDNGEINKFLV